MRNVLIGCGILIAIVAVFSLVLGVVIIGYYNKEAELRNQFNSQTKANEAVFDQCWKVISQQAQVTDQYKEAFRSVWAEIVKGGSGGTAALQVFVNHHNPQFDSKLYLKLMNTIESERKQFTNNQKKLIDIKREHDNIRLKFPSSIFVGSKPELELKLVTSDRTDEAFQSGKDNNVDVFQSKEKK